MITFDQQTNMFHLSTKHTSYVFDYNGHSQYWGSMVDAKDCVGLNEHWSHSSFDPDIALENLEFPIKNGRSFIEPCLRAQNALFFNVKTYIIDGEKLTVTYEENIHHMMLQLNYEVFPEYDIIARSAILKNGSRPIVIDRFLSANWNLPEHRGTSLRYLTGKWVGECEVVDQDVETGIHMIQSVRGIPGPHFNPSFAVHEHASENTGNVWYGLLAYSGDWKIEVEKTNFGHLHILGGRNDFDGSIELGAGETLCTPIFYAGFTQNGFGEMSRNLHAFEIECIAHATQPRRVIYNSWEATTFAVHAKKQMELAEVAARMGVELFVVDDGWFGERHSERAGLGDWYVNRDKFPNGLSELVSHVRQLGMDFGIWVEPESINPDSDLFRAHPDWVYHLNGIEPMLARNQLLLNLSLPPVIDYLKQCLSELLKENEIAFLKWDMNRPLTDISDPSLRLQHVDALYGLLAWLKAEFPHVEIESCSGGGGRVDVGILRYANQFWPSDNTDPFDRLWIQYGFSQFYAPGLMMCWVTDTPASNGRLERDKTAYKFHSAMCGGLGIGANIGLFSDEQIIEYANYIAQYKAIRETVQFGKLYRLLAPSENISAVEYVSNNGNEIVVFAFLHSQRLGNHCPRLRLNGLEPTAYYLIDQKTVIQGASLQHIGLPLQLHGDFGSVCIQIRKVAQS